MSGKLQWHHPGGRLRELGLGSVSDAGLLATLISSSVKDRPAAQIADDILAKFGFFRGIATQPLQRLLDIEGVKEIGGVHNQSQGRELLMSLSMDYTIGKVL